MNSISRIIRQPAIAPLILVAACAPAAPSRPPAAIPELAGRTAGVPQRCVPIRQNDSLRIADSGIVLYGSGRTLWLNRLGSDCPGMTRMDVLVVEPTGSQYCRGDLVRTVDPVSRIPGPACRLGDFVPYTR